MDFLNGKIKTIYFKYLSAAFGSALITSMGRRVQPPWRWLRRSGILSTALDF